MDHRSHEQGVVYSKDTKIECTLSIFSTLGLAFFCDLNKVLFSGTACIFESYSLLSRRMAFLKKKNRQFAPERCFLSLQLAIPITDRVPVLRGDEFTHRKRVGMIDLAPRSPFLRFPDELLRFPLANSLIRVGVRKNKVIGLLSFSFFITSREPV